MRNPPPSLYLIVDLVAGWLDLNSLEYNESNVVMIPICDGKV